MIPHKDHPVTGNLHGCWSDGQTQAAPQECDPVDGTFPSNPSNGDTCVRCVMEKIGPGSYTGIASAGPFHLFFEEPGDFGGTAIVDGRDGAIAFAGTVIWLGCGVINVPDGSTHGWTFPGGDAALGPGDVEILPNEYWGDIFGSPDSVTTMTLDYLRQSDVLKSFGACDTYDVVSYIYTPAVGATDPTLAGCVIIVSGHCGPPWNGDEVPIRPTSWNKVKARYK